MTLRIGLLAGEASGDNLGAGLMQALSEQLDEHEQVSFVGVGGPRMQALGLESLADINQLGVNGFREPLVKLPSLYRLLRRLVAQLKQRQIDIFVGIDFNVFNFLLEARLKKAGIPTAHYVSPSVYAWRTGRTRRIARSADLLLCLYPFEPAFYAQTNIKAVFTGHPLADEITQEASAQGARHAVREELGVSKEVPVLALLPGSRSGEVRLMLEPFVQAANLVAAQLPGLVVVIPCVRKELREQVSQNLAAISTHTDLQIVCYEGNARKALIACDIALIKSGTSTLEAMLLHRPMVVSYRLGMLSYQFAKRVLRTPFIALPNILSGYALVPELLQDEGSPENLSEALLTQWRTRNTGKLQDRFVQLHEQLQQDANRQAALAVLGLVQSRSNQSIS